MTKYQCIFRLIGIAPILIVLCTCGSTKQTPASSFTLPAGYRLVFGDEFNGVKLDTAVWGFHNLGKRRSAVNVKRACIPNGKGKLEIRNWTEKGENALVHHAGMIQTKENFLFGYYEARIKFEMETGAWGAFWIMYNHFSRIGEREGDPREDGVEIDIAEFVPKDNRYICHNLHWNGYKQYHQSVGSGPLLNGRLNGYHTYGLLWTPEEYIFYIDGKETWRTSAAMSHVPEYVILSTEIEDKGWAGDIPPDGYGSFAETRNIMYVDYIRIYQKKK